LCNDEEFWNYLSLIKCKFYELWLNIFVFYFGLLLFMNWMSVWINESCLKIQNLIKLFKLIKLIKNKINNWNISSIE
jgi:hypothetical protein